MDTRERSHIQEQTWAAEISYGCALGGSKCPAICTVILFIWDNIGNVPFFILVKHWNFVVRGASNSNLILNWRRIVQSLRLYDWCSFDPQVNRICILFCLQSYKFPLKFYSASLQKQCVSVACRPTSVIFTNKHRKSWRRHHFWIICQIISLHFGVKELQWNGRAKEFHTARHSL